MAKIGNFSRYCLNLQGYTNLDDEAKSRFCLAIRFTPGVCTLLIVAGIILRSPIWLGILAVIAFIGAVFPKGHLIDIFYNALIRHLFGAPPLPPNPKPRRFGFLVATAFLIGAALSFQYGKLTLGYVLGGFLTIACGVVAITNWCLASWMYRLIFGRGGVAR